MAAANDRPAAALVPRYSSAALPSYRYRLRGTPHPRRDPRGHSYGVAEPSTAPWEAEQWAALEPWLFAVDLFNDGYWWEAHEQLEALWLAAGRTTPRARFVQGLIKVAAALLHRAAGDVQAATDQAEAGLALMAATAAGERYMGVDAPSFAADVRATSTAAEGRPLLRLAAAR